jgi:SAM-dependent methyltransferase
VDLVRTAGAELVAGACAGVTTPQPVGRELRSQFGDIDIYLFDQLLRGRFDARSRVLDAGCGDGRNLIYLLQHGFKCYGVDEDASAIEIIRRTAARLAPHLPAENFRVGSLEQLPHADGSVDVVLASAVLHFARDEDHWTRMVQGMWRVLAPNGLLFARLASNIGLESTVGPAGRVVRLPDGSTRFVVDEVMLLAWTERLGGRLADPIKTTNVQQQRCMTTWCVIKT